MIEGILGAGSISIGGIDIAVIVLYFVVIIGLGVWAGLKRRGRQKARHFLAAARSRGR
jgi:Na+/proline symporter